MKITSDQLRELFNTPFITDDTLKSHIKSVVSSQFDSETLSPVHNAIGSCIGVRAPTDVRAGPDKCSFNDALNFIFEIKSLDDLTALLLLQIINIRLANEISTIVDNDKISVIDSGIVCDEAVEDGIIVQKQINMSSHRIITRNRSYNIYVCIPNCDKNGITYTDEQCDQILDAGVGIFFSTVLGLYQTQVID